MMQIRQSLRLIIGAALAFGLWNYLQWGEAYWIVISTLLGLQISNTPLLRRKNFFLISTGLIASITTSVANILTPEVFLLAIFLFITTFASISVGLRWPLIWGGAFVANYYANLFSSWPGSLASIGHRFASILLGFVIAIFLQALFFPGRLQNDVKLMLAGALEELSRLSESIFTCYLAKDYVKNSFVYDQQLHARRRDYLCEIYRARALIAKMKLPMRDKFKKVLDDMEQGYELVLSLGNLIYRVTDHTTFEVAYKEFLSISKNIFSDLRQLKSRLLNKKTSTMSDSLKENIYQLEDVNRSALNVVSKDPMVFLIFIEDLYKFNEILTQLSLDIDIAMSDKK